MSQNLDSPGVDTDAVVHVVSGVFSHSIPLAGLTVAEIRQGLTELMNIDTQAIPVVDGSPVEESTVLTAGQVLNFVRLAGEMG